MGWMIRDTNPNYPRGKICPDYDVPAPVKEREPKNKGRTKRKRESVDEGQSSAPANQGSSGVINTPTRITRSMQNASKVTQSENASKDKIVIKAHKKTLGLRSKLQVHKKPADLVASQVSVTKGKVPTDKDGKKPIWRPPGKGQQSNTKTTHTQEEPVLGSYYVVLGDK